MKFSLLLRCAAALALGASALAARAADEVVITGGVEKPGRYPLEPGKGAAAMLLTAGGLTADGCSEVTIIGQVDGKNRRFHLNLWEQIAEFQSDWRLQPGDQIFVTQHSVGCIRDVKRFNELLAEYLAARASHSDKPPGWKEKLKPISGGHGKLTYNVTQRDEIPASPKRP